jgi:hypothetical protein
LEWEFFLLFTYISIFIISLYKKWLILNFCNIKQSYSLIIKIYKLILYNDKRYNLIIVILTNYKIEY